MKLLWQLLCFASLFFLPSLAQRRDVVTTLRRMGFTEWADIMAADPELLSMIRSRNDITVSAPPNYVVRRQGLQRRQEQPLRINAKVQTSYSGTPPKSGTVKPGGNKKRQSPDIPPSNFEVINSFFSDPEYVNLGGNPSSPWTVEPIRFVRNYGSPRGLWSQPPYEVTTGLGRVVTAGWGPFKVDNGVIYKVKDVFTFPGFFNETFQEITTAERFYDAITSSGSYPLFQDTPRVTIFAPVDSSYPEDVVVNPRDYIITNVLGFTPELYPATYTTPSGREIRITWGPNGVRLINGRRIVQANIPTRNGVVHFIDGLLF